MRVTPTYKQVLEFENTADYQINDIQEMFQGITISSAVSSPVFSGQLYNYCTVKRRDLVIQAPPGRMSSPAVASRFLTCCSPSPDYAEPT